MDPKQRALAHNTMVAAGMRSALTQALEALAVPEATSLEVACVFHEHADSANGTDVQSRTYRGTLVMLAVLLEEVTLVPAEVPDVG